MTASILMLVSGATHAVVNAVLKSGKDKMSGRALIDGFSALIMLPAVFWFPLPHGAWTFLAASWVSHLAYLFCLIKAFEAADMTVAYPILRGVAPTLASAGAVLLFGEPISASTAAGVGLVSAGVVTVGLGRAVQRDALFWALLTGFTVAVYTVVDAQGVRAAPTAGSYIAWVYVSLGLGIGGLFAAWRGPAFVVAARSEWRPGLAAGALSIVTYGSALTAYRLGGTPRLAALRETSVVVATAIGVFVLKEDVTVPRMMGIAMIVGGAAVLLVT